VSEDRCPLYSGDQHYVLNVHLTLLNVVRHSCWDVGCVTGTWTQSFLIA